MQTLLRVKHFWLSPQCVILFGVSSTVCVLLKHVCQDWITIHPLTFSSARNLPEHLEKIMTADLKPAVLKITQKLLLEIFDYMNNSFVINEAQYFGLASALTL